MRCCNKKNNYIVKIYCNLPCISHGIYHFKLIKNTLLIYQRFFIYRFMINPGNSFEFSKLYRPFYLRGTPFYAGMLAGIVVEVMKKRKIKFSMVIQRIKYNSHKKNSSKVYLLFKIIQLLFSLIISFPNRHD